MKRTLVQGNQRYATMADHSEALRAQGYTCAESILIPYADKYGLAPDMASRIAGGFGFVTGKHREQTCGVVTGAIMVIGLEYGAGLGADPFARDMCTLMTQEFVHRFTTLRDSVICRFVHRSHQKTVTSLTEKRAFCARVTRQGAAILVALLEDQSAQP